MTKKEQEEKPRLFFTEWLVIAIVVGFTLAVIAIACYTQIFIF